MKKNPDCRRGEEKLARATRKQEDLFAQSQPKSKKLTLTGYAAVWHDDATETYGTERVFLSRARCLTFAANLIVRKSKEREVSILDLDAPPSTWKGKKVYPSMSEHNGGGCALVFARTDTSAWQNLIFPFAYAILFLKGRLRFCRADGTDEGRTPAPSALIAYSPADVNAIAKSGIEGFLVKLK